MQPVPWLRIIDQGYEYTFTNRRRPPGLARSRVIPVQVLCTVTILYLPLKAWTLQMPQISKQPQTRCFDPPQVQSVSAIPTTTRKIVICAPPAILSEDHQVEAFACPITRYVVPAAHMARTTRLVTYGPHTKPIRGTPHPKVGTSPWP